MPPSGRSGSARASVGNDRSNRSNSNLLRNLAMCLLHLLDLLQPTHVAFPYVEFRTQERAHELAGQLRTDHLGSEAQNVHVVVLDALVGRVRVVADRGPDARDLAGGDRSADAGPADEDSKLGVTVSDRGADLAGLVRIVDVRLRRIGPEVDRLVPGAHDLLEHALSQLHAAMVEGDRDPHRAVTLPAWKGRNCGVSSVSSCASTPFGRLRSRNPGIRLRRCPGPISWPCCSRSTCGTTSTTRTTRGTTISSSPRGTHRRSCTRSSRPRVRSRTRSCLHSASSGAGSRGIRLPCCRGWTWRPAPWARGCRTASASRSRASGSTGFPTARGCCAATARWPRARCGRRSSTPGTSGSTT